MGIRGPQFVVIATLLLTGQWMGVLSAEEISTDHGNPGPLERISTAKDSHLPSWLTLGFEYRGRLEHPTSKRYTPEPNELYYLHRIRFDASARVKPWIRFSAQVQDSRAPGWGTTPAPASVRNTTELRLAHVDLGSDERGWQFIGGRQALQFGSSRLISTSNWGNVGTAFDGLRLSYRTRTMKLDGFASSKVRPADGQIDRFNIDRKLWGFYSTWYSVPRVNLVDGYVIGADNDSSREKFQTFGGRAVDRFSPHLDGEMEIAVQRGQTQDESLSAWGGHWELGYHFRTSDSSPRLFFEYSYASGDDNPGDQTTNTFQQLYPTHKWATIDSIAWRNIHEPLLGLTVHPARRWEFEARFRSFWLASKSDCLYGLSGSILACDPDAPSSHVGEEADARVTFRLSRHMELMGGYAYLWPGAYLKGCTPGASPSLAYAMWTFRI